METHWLLHKLSRSIVYLNNHPLSPRCLHLSFLSHKPWEIDELVAKIEGAWEKKDDAQKDDIQEKIKKVVESPSSAFSLFGKKKSKKWSGFSDIFLLCFRKNLLEKGHKLFDFMHKQCYRHNNWMKVHSFSKC